MRHAHPVETVRAAEAALMARLPEGTLMQRAAAGLAATCARLLTRRRGRVYGGRVTVLAGSGDNGGDALYAGAALARRGARVTAVLLTPEKAHPGGLAALRAAGGRVTAEQQVGLAEFSRADLVLDGIVGIGGRGGLRPGAAPYARAGRSGIVVAVDLPSGVDADTGEVPGEALRADVTVCFGTYKPGLLIDPGAEYTGAVQLVDIGLELPEPEVTALQHADAAALLPLPGAESDKYRRGVVGVAAGSARYPGAALLAVAGALRGGAGAVRYVGTAAEEVVRRFPETLVTEGGPAGAGRVQAWVVGPGGGEGARQALTEALASDVPVLVDADGLTELGRLGPDALAGRTAPTLLTPHTGEAARLLAGAEGGAPPAAEELAAARLATARRLAAAYRATVLLKGSTTVVADPGGAVRVNPTGTSWLATAGSGDVLAGLAGSLLATGLSPLDAASLAAYLHGLAAREAAGDPGAPVTALAVAGALPTAWRAVRGA
ncbi:bifunctional ADP-dependent NAD(P)H-hydrate dehydratase/NAD(P)H-hydrate epimerase [Kitasatospora aureofaciens]|uniref:bifunctional ADP-dependent NAD(P)H-hydrate dehydratase/NAD(P)H-hydrate epimerase n=1 Tax=Kitasatospora aureofaciens TaxID=1894 RepID=UPI000525812D|nr:bifunctional ADP-dependent NAD(P)H-hydrate dehydratase/NAD(P)H-hydrate epimerase [Kitasatospora aureofaciens]HJD82943.1 bifunctional ADP-dependent NAD(P)H-hydrate dehydratase/NAD(P)H-hydrate epimerase [Kitasatospora aureofaciens]